ncbi:hypothetical protein GCM10010123_11730 [Pilimelia anulata]|uniref:Peptidase S1 domain-containing protein n=1 Tax=Pilimelia anulata TaxID=53371 RepID=A0A8J3B8Q0_9ACTN|nr:trypsin-like serine protease [Pilimelia anulata]GGJ83678.1 hypothetical protein GCM10010123_11730 [Pilimelia anulata]
MRPHPPSARPRPRTALAALAALAVGVAAALAAPAAAGAALAAEVVDGRPAPAYVGAASISRDAAGVGSFCSGTLIAPTWVLTAGHCAAAGGEHYVRTGSLDNTAGGEVRRVVERVARGPGGDLALLRLAAPVAAAPIRLAAADPPLGAESLIYGWGRTCADCAGSPVLRVARVRYEAITADFLGGPALHSAGIDGAAHRGDSGGPQVYNGEQVGVCSTGDAAARTQDYASIATHRAWIRAHTGV